MLFDKYKMYQMWKCAKDRSRMITILSQINCIPPNQVEKIINSVAEERELKETEYKKLLAESKR